MTGDVVTYNGQKYVARCDITPSRTFDNDVPYSACAVIQSGGNLYQVKKGGQVDRAVGDPTSTTTNWALLRLRDDPEEPGHRSEELGGADERARLAEQVG